MLGIEADRFDQEVDCRMSWYLEKIGSRLIHSLSKKLLFVLLLSQPSSLAFCRRVPQAQSSAPQVSILSVSSQYVMWALDEQLSQIRVSFFTDSQLASTLTGLCTLRTQTHVAACITALRNREGIFHRQHEGQYDNRTGILQLFH